MPASHPLSMVSVLPNSSPSPQIGTSPFASVRHPVSSTPSSPLVCPGYLCPKTLPNPHSLSLSAGRCRTPLAPPHSAANIASIAATTRFRASPNDRDSTTSAHRRCTARSQTTRPSTFLSRFVAAHLLWPLRSRTQRGSQSAQKSAFFSKRSLFPHISTWFLDPIEEFF